MKRILLAFLLVLPGIAPAFAQSAGYRIQPGDELAITVLEDDTLNRQLLVLPDGTISVPLAGTVRAGGRSVESVEAAIADQLASNFAVRPSVFVSVVTVDETYGTFPIFVMGQVTTPGHATVLLPSRERGSVRLPDPPGGAGDLQGALDEIAARWDRG